MSGSVLVIRLLDAVTDVPSPSPTPEFDPDRVSPGPLGFLAIFFVAVMVVLLVVDMTRRIRRTRYRAEIVGRLEAEKLEADLARDAAPGRETSTPPGSTQGAPDSAGDPDDPAAPPRS